MQYTQEISRKTACFGNPFTEVFLNERTSLDPFQNNFPVELVHRIFFHLDESSRKAAVLVNWDWNKTVIDQDRAEQSFKLNNLIRIGINILSKDLLKNRLEIEECRSTLEDNLVSRSWILFQVRQGLHSLKDSLAKKFQKTNETEYKILIDCFTQQEMPIGYENFIELIKFYVGCYQASLKTNEEERSAFFLFFGCLMEAQGDYRSAEMAYSQISLKADKTGMFEIYSCILLSSKMYEKAIEIVKLHFNNSFHRYYQIASIIISGCNKIEDFDEAIKIIDKLPINKDVWFDEISKSILEKLADFEKANDVALKIIDDEMRGQRLKSIKLASLL